jgi:uncharacterized damage-inducible protein DinB
MSVDFRRLLAYDDWANREALASLRRCKSPPETASGRLAHIVGAQWTWLGRVTGAEGAKVWPDLDLDRCEEQLRIVARQWHDLLANLAEGDAARVVSYANTKGQRFESTLGEILLQVVLHGAHHRGQIAAELRALGHEPAVTDFIHAAREKLVP